MLPSQNPNCSRTHSHTRSRLSALEEEGPFDGLIAFLQGAALAASLILQYSTQAQPLERCAIFFSGALPWMLRSEVIALHHHYARLQPAKLAVSFPPQARDPLIVYTDLSEQKGLVEEVLWVHLILSPLRFPIPTTFIHGGKKDELSFQAIAFMGLGNEEIGVKVMNHEAGHVIPRGESVTGDMAEAVVWTIERACFRS